MEHQHSVPEDTPRATRFPLRLRAHYRREPSGGWHRAMTVNVSRTGVLLRGQEPVDAGRVIEIMFRLSRNLLDTDTPSSAVICQCRVVRIQAARENDDLLIAAKIVAYAFHRS